MKDVFRECNKKYFNNSLPLPKFDIMHRYVDLAYFIYQKEKDNKRMKHKKIYFTDYYDFDDEMIVNLMVHEMIHYYLAYNKIDPKCKHGKEFNEMAEKLNKEYGLNITSKIDAPSLKRNEKAPKLSYMFLKFLGIS